MNILSTQITILPSNYVLLKFRFYFTQMVMVVNVIMTMSASYMMMIAYLYAVYLNYKWILFSQRFFLERSFPTLQLQKTDFLFWSLIIQVKELHNWQADLEGWQ